MITFNKKSMLAASKCQLMVFKLRVVQHRSSSVNVPLTLLSYQNPQNDHIYNWLQFSVLVMAAGCNGLDS